MHNQTMAKVEREESNMENRTPAYTHNMVKTLGDKTHTQSEREKPVTS